MAVVEVVMSAEMFSANVVATTAQRYTGEFYVEVSDVAAGRLVCLSPIRAETSIDRVQSRFLNDALDERLRERVRSETGDLQAILVQAALQGALGRIGTP